MCVLHETQIRLKLDLTRANLAFDLALPWLNNHILHHLKIAQAPLLLDYLTVLLVLNWQLHYIFCALLAERIALAVLACSKLKRDRVLFVLQVISLSD